MILSSVYQYAGRGTIYSAYSVVTTPSLYTAAAVNGFVLWNGSNVGAAQKVNAYILFVSYGLSVASAVAGSLLLSGTITQPAAPTSTTGITAVGNMRVGGQAPQCTPYNAGTVAVAAGATSPLFIIGMVHTGALTVDTTDANPLYLDGAMEVQPGNTAIIAGSVALTSAVLQVNVVWAEVPQ